MTDTASSGEHYRPAEVSDFAKLLQSWSIWLVTIQTGALAVIGGIAHQEKRPEIDPGAMVAAMTAAIFFMLSIGFATFLLVALPSFAARSRQVATSKDLIEEKAYVGDAASFWSPTLRKLVDGEQWCFLLGIVAFLVFVLLGLSELDQARG
jgi:hypothetical protein